MLLDCKPLQQQKEWEHSFCNRRKIASKEQVESLGGKFLTVEGSDNLETEGGYAKEVSDDFKKTRRIIKRDFKKN